MKNLFIEYAKSFSRIRGGDPWARGEIGYSRWVFPAYAGVIPPKFDNLGANVKFFPHTRG
ncbi:hypothetical protein HMPREF0091_10531 [Fannyhessea vaginae DSM 15829]|uniref:Uncharacterized protein n=1 Tax=Fannyhessea vaginae DSM 15829 TaxID=525256 RepID=F1T4E0_9ACTN|nr:hypothetical protein HMPREF0091_10531 [Fannyhessea vaginae DSM 15829]